MANVLINDRVLVSFIGNLCGQLVMNTFMYKVSAAAPDATQDSAFTALHGELLKASGVQKKFLNVTPTNYTLTQMWYQVVSPVRYRKMVFAVNTPGLSGAIAYSANIQAGITRVGEKAKRSEVGGIRIPIGTSLEASSEGIITAPLVTGLTNLATAMMLTIITAAPVVTFIPQVGTPKDAQQSVDLWNAFPQNTTRTMHRRTVGLGK